MRLHLNNLRKEYRIQPYNGVLVCAICHAALAAHIFSSFFEDAIFGVCLVKAQALRDATVWQIERLLPMEMETVISLR